MDQGKKKVQRRQRRRFTDEYKAQKVKLVLSSHRTAGQVARDLEPRTKRQGNPVARIPLSFCFTLVDPTGIEPVTS